MVVQTTQGSKAEKRSEVATPPVIRPSIRIQKCFVAQARISVARLARVNERPNSSLGRALQYAVPEVHQVLPGPARLPDVLVDRVADLRLGAEEDLPRVIGMARHQQGV